MSTGPVMRADRPTRVLLGTAALWSVGLVIAALTAPFCSSTSASSTSPSSPAGASGHPMTTPTQVAHTSATLVQVNGFKVLAPVSLPFLAVAVVAFALLCHLPEEGNHWGGVACMDRDRTARRCRTSWDTQHRAVHSPSRHPGRLGRSLEHLITLSSELQRSGIDLVVLDQGIDTPTALGRMFFQILGAIAEFEHVLMSERTRHCLAGARARGRTGGQRPKLSPRQAAMAQDMYDALGPDGKRAYTVAEISPARCPRPGYCGFRAYVGCTPGR